MKNVIPTQTAAQVGIPEGLWLGICKRSCQCAQMEPRWNHFHPYGALLREGVGEDGHDADVWGVKAD